MKRIAAIAAVLLLLGWAPAEAEVEVTLRGSRESMQRQNRIARELDFSFLRTSREVRAFAEGGWLVPLPGSDDYRVIASWPWARPVVRDFIEILSRGYRNACGEPLVVTSLTRPVQRQPPNASPLSVHPAGMAVDLRVSARSACVRWLQAELLALETDGLLDATREYRPPHFHVAVFPEPFAAFVARRMADSVQTAEAARADSLRLALAAQQPADVAPEPTSAPAPSPHTAWPLILLAAIGQLLLRV